MLRARLGAILPVRVRRRLRPLVAPLLYRLEQPRMRRLYSTLVGPGDLVFDIGAAEGYHTEVLVGLGATVVAVEPRPDAATVLRRRFAGRPVEVVEAGVGSAAGRGVLHVCDGDPELSTFDIDGRRSGRYGGRRWGRQLRVPVTTLAELAARHGRPRFVKVDVEGVEAEVLASLDALPEALSFEFHADEPESVRSCLARLEAIGSVRYDLSLYRRFRLHCGRWLAAPALLELLASLPAGSCGDVYARRNDESCEVLRDLHE